MAVDPISARGHRLLQRRKQRRLAGQHLATRIGKGEPLAWSISASTAKALTRLPPF
ncbi:MULTISPECIES: hypothetical protein [Sphingobium]|uniref:hypothetical protein n=1 Tax=Sphingobium sp. MI1205 TaxID=407020 RepID=UPI000A434C59|nr:hypothetical protein [Sphingobium sp. MI1205]